MQRNRLLRPFSQINNLTYEQPAARRGQGPLAPDQREPPLLGRVHRERGAVVQQQPRSNRTVEEYDREPTLWLDDNNSRPCRLSGGAVYELPFGAGKPMLNDGGIAGRARRRLADWPARSKYQPGSLITFDNNLFYLRRHRRHQEETSRRSR